MRSLVVAPSIRRQNAARTAAAGADAVIAGSAIFGSTGYAAAIAAIRRSAPREMRAPS